MNSATDPKPVDDVQGDGRWMSQHKRFVDETKEKEPEIVFIGDSLIQQIANTELWKKLFEPLHCLNFGIGGDQTQNILWRIQNGEMDCIEPKVVVLLAGTNNYDHTAEQVAEGLMEIVSAVQHKQPKTQIVVMGIPPRGENPNPLREKVAKINSIVSDQLSSIPNATFLATDPSLFVDKNDKISHTDMYDYLHLTTEGYQKICEPLLDTIQDLAQDFVKVENISLDSDSLAGDLATKAP